MALHQHTGEGASAPSDLSCAREALGYALRLITWEVGPKKRRKLVERAYRSAVAIEQDAKVRLLKAQGDAKVRPLRSLSFEEVRQRQAQIDALAMLIPELRRELDALNPEGEA